MRQVLLVLAGLSIGPAFAVLLLVLSGGLDVAEVTGLAPAGPLIRYGLPLTQTVRDLAAAVTVGALVVAAVCVPPEDPSQGSDISGGRRRLVDVAALAASVWFWMGLLLLAFTYSDAAGVPVTSPDFAQGLVYFTVNFDMGRYLAIGSVIAGVVSIRALRAVRMTATGFFAVLALIGLWPMALTGHAAGALNHDHAVNIQAMHLVGLSVWGGGLLALMAVRPVIGQELLLSTVKRYSTLAAWSLALVSISGILAAGLRVPGPQSLLSSYGGLLAVKVGAVLSLAGLGLWQRRVGIQRLQDGRPRSFLRIVALELVVLAGAAGAGVALSRTPPPVPTTSPQPLSTAQSLLGRDMPPPLGVSEWFTQWQPDSLWLPVALLALGWYLGAALRLRDRGDRWPVMRTLSWVFGWLLFAWAISGAPGAYGRVLFSMHMVQHMTIATAVPAFLVLGAPVTLALRTLTRRRDGSSGPREWLLTIVHSWPARLLGSPIVAAAMFVLSLAAFYYSSLFELTLRAHTAHVIMTAHFLLSGYLLANTLVGIDPGPRRLAHPFRVLLLMVTFAFHALFSVSIMQKERILAADWFTLLPRDWGRSVADDQYFGASIGWALGDYPLGILGGALIWSWFQSDRRERRRYDRQAERDGDQELTAYNDYLRGLGPVDGSRTRSEP